MKNTSVTIAGIASILYAIPASISELTGLISTDKEKGEAVALNAANQYFLQQNLIKVRSEVAKALSKQFEIQPKIYIGKTEVIATVDNEGEVNGYKAAEGKKIFKATETVKKESAKEFIDRVISEKELTEETVKGIVQAIADANPFSAEQKRVRGSVASKPVGKKWLTLAEKIIKAGNGEAAASKLSAELGELVSVAGEDGAKRLALALSEKSRRAKEAAEKEGEEYAGTEEAPLVVAGV